jgi:hypothetical protein
VVRPLSRDTDNTAAVILIEQERHHSVMELFMAGGNYAASAVPLPTGFPDAVQAEIAAAQ